MAAARDCEEWMAALADYFARHGLAFGHGTDNAGDEAFWLLRHLQGWGDADFAAAPAPDVTARAIAIAERRVRDRKPLAYLLNEAWFADLKFYVDENSLSLTDTSDASHYGFNKKGSKYYFTSLMVEP